MKFKFAALSLISVLLTACGGGGDDGPKAPDAPPAAASASPEGRWSVHGDHGAVTVLTVLENGDVWGRYTRPSENGLGYGTVAEEDGTLKLKMTDINLTNSAIEALEGSVNVIPQTRMEIKSANNALLTLTYDDTYNQPAQVEALAGNYEGVAYMQTSKPSPTGGDVKTPKSGASEGATSTTTQFSQDQTTVAISDKGEVTLTSEKNCSATGTILPRATGKNVLDVALTFTGSACMLDDGANLKGIASYESEGSQVQIQAMDESRTKSFSFTAPKTK